MEGRKEVGMEGRRWEWKEGGGNGRKEVGMEGRRWEWKEGGGNGRNSRISLEWEQQLKLASLKNIHIIYTNKQTYISILFII